MRGLLRVDEQYIYYMPSKRCDEVMLNSDNSLQLDLFPFFLPTKYGIPLARGGDGPFRSNKLVLLGARRLRFLITLVALEDSLLTPRLAYVAHCVDNETGYF